MAHSMLGFSVGSVSPAERAILRVVAQRAPASVSIAEIAASLGRPADGDLLIQINGLQDRDLLVEDAGGWRAADGMRP